jgi:TetR/AcrR family transcriptional regulator, regulator of cefoperazone and chloramphenicol sensitivity
MLAAAVECIVEEGYYRASSNRIAQRAGVTWGVIQYHFGTREQLLLAVARQGAEELVHVLTDAEITGDSVEERLDSLADVIWLHYRRPEFLAHVQVILNLSKDPRTSSETVRALADTERRIAAQWQRLVQEVLPGRGHDPELGSVIFELIRGAAIGEGLLEALPRAGRKAAGTGGATRASLVRALALLLAEG